jgi:stearoyl-CoA desaturase (Delta-9 desaturase)
VAPKQLPISWLNVIFLATVHVLAVGGMVAYLLMHGLTWAAAGIGMVWTSLTILSISAGYHRLFSHRTYEAHPVFRFFLLAFGASAFQNTALAWATDHRRHHSQVDTALDPYDATEGFWYSHIGWVLRKTDPSITQPSVRDLEADPLIAWQHKYYAWIGGAAGFVVPLLLGFAFGDPWGGLVVGGLVRLVFVYQATFAINSVAHIIGTQPYSDRDSSRDSFVTALVSMGEGYHNFHHTFPGDYRNGVRAHHFDPTKWLIRTLAAIGVARNLRRTPAAAVLRARVRMEERRLSLNPIPAATGQRLQSARATVDAALTRWQSLMSRYEEMKAEAGSRWEQSLKALRAEIRIARREVQIALAHWRQVVRQGLRAPQPVRVRARR